MNYLNKENVLYLYFEDDFDYMKIQSIKEEVVQLLESQSYEKAIFDFEKITFVDSTGIGFVLARYKQLAQKKKELILSNLNKENKIIFEMSGVFQIIKHQNNEVKQ